MKPRIPTVLLALVAALLAADLLRSVPVAQAEGREEVPAVLRAHAFELVDAEGKAVAQLFLGEDGGGNLRLRSSDGVVRVKLGASDDGSGLLLFDVEAEPAVWLASGGSGTKALLAEKGRGTKALWP
jgi:hypothetical protein